MKTNWRHWVLAMGLCAPFLAAHADSMIKPLPFQHAWTDIAQITANDNWSGVQGIEGYLGQDITTVTGADPQTLLGVSANATDLDVVANQSNPNTTSAGGVIEFHLADPTIALQGSGTADAPYLLIHLDTRGKANINVAYNLRDVDGSADNAIQPVALQYRVGGTGNFTNVPAGFVADATTGPSLATLVTAVSATLPVDADNQQLVQVRIITANASGNDETVGIDDIAVTGTDAGGPPVLSISDASGAEGDGPGNTMSGMLIARLSAPAGPGGVSFTATTAGGTATPDVDFIPQSWGGVIPEGLDALIFQVPVIGDTTPEADETFFINLSDVAGAVLGDGQGVGTIVNDDFVVVPIHDVQGAGATSPFANQFVTLEGVVTGRKGNGFFLQASDAEADANALTSEGVFVFTSSAPPAAAAVGNRVRVQGTVIEYIPAADPNQLPLTEISGSPLVTELSTGNALPMPVAITVAMTNPAGGLGQLEHLEGMRVSVASLTTIAGSEGNATPHNATGSVNGIIHAVVTGVARPFREPGIQAPDAAPGGGTTPPIPRWDANPEILTIDSDSLGGAGFALDLPAGSVIEGLTGPLDYGFRRYTLHRDPLVAINVVPGANPRAARLPGSDEFTVAAYNLERFYDNINDPNDDSVASLAAYTTRLKKASLGIRNYLHAPDILVAIEVEKLEVLQALASRINSDAVAAGQPDPQYVAYLEEGNDVGGIDVGVLVKTATVAAAIPRVDVLSVTQVGKDTTWLQPDGSTGLLNDRPPLAVDAMVHYADGRTFPVTVIGVHQRSLIDAELDTAAGDRVRKKRQRQAEFLADYIQQRQVASPETRLVVLGDFNAFAFNDGLADTMNVVSGTPTPDAETAVPGDGIDLVDPDLVNLGELAPAGERYSFVFDGNAQTLDHVLLNEELIVTSDASLDHARINADFQDTHRSIDTTATRTADHDPVIAYFAPRVMADVSVSAGTVATSAGGAGTLQFRSSVRNHGPQAAEAVAVGFAVDAELPTMTVAAPHGWTCDTAQVEAGRTSVACETPSMALDAEAAFTISASTTAESVHQTVNLAAAVVTKSLDPNAANDEASASVNIMAKVDLSTQVAGPRKGARPGTPALVSVTLRNAGPYEAIKTKLTITGNAAATGVTLPAPAGWQCAVEGDDSSFIAECAYTKLFGAKTSQRFDLTVVAPAQGILSVTALAHSDSVDTNVANDAANYSQMVSTP